MALVPASHQHAVALVAHAVAPPLPISASESPLLLAMGMKEAFLKVGG